MLTLSVGLPHWLSRGHSVTGAAVPEGYRHFVLDISHHQPRDIQWDSLKVVIDAQGLTTRNLAGARAILPVQHVIMKATEGESMKDSHFAAWWAESHTLSRGAYHFFLSAKDPQLQAQNYIATVHLSHKDLPPVLDIETVHKGCTKEQLNSKLLNWLRMVEAHYGRTPIVYTSDAFARDWLGREILGNFPLWIARYNTLEPTTPGWRFWQFTDEAVVYGVKGKVDLSVF